MKFVSQSENSVAVLFEQTISTQVATEVYQFTQLIEKELARFIIDVVPSYASIHISFNLRIISHQDFVKTLQRLANKTAESEQRNIQKRTTIEIPVYYGEEVGFDLAEMATQTGLTIEQIIQKHSDLTYDVYALGFSPGFAYLGKVDQQIAVPRKETPRLEIPQGSLGIAGEQTAIYPFTSPGGWNIIGRTPLQMVDYTKQPPCLVQVGDRVKFKPITQSEFSQLRGEL